MRTCVGLALSCARVVSCMIVITRSYATSISLSFLSYCVYTLCYVILPFCVHTPRHVLSLCPTVYSRHVHELAEFGSVCIAGEEELRDNWPDLFPLLQQCVTSDVPHLRMIAHILLAKLAEVECDITFSLSARNSTSVYALPYAFTWDGKFERGSIE